VHSLITSQASTNTRPHYDMLVMNISTSGHVGFNFTCTHIVSFALMCTSFTLFVLWNHVSSVGIVTNLLLDDSAILIVVWFLGGARDLFLSILKHADSFGGLSGPLVKVYQV
jgi:hypothetical protein